MRFLLLTQYFPPEIGAPSARLSALARELRRKGHEIEVVTALPNYPTGAIFPEYRGKLYVSERWEDVPVHRVWLYPALGSGLKRMLNYLSFTTASFFALSKVGRPDFVFVESPPLFLGIVGWWASRMWGVPMIFNVADLWPDAIASLGVVNEGPLLRMAYRFEEWIYRQATFINAVTEGIRDALIQTKGVSEEKILFLPNGVDTDLFRPLPVDEDLRRELRLEGERIVLYAGNHGIYQGLEVVIKAARLLQDITSSVRFLFVGDGSEKKRLMAMAKDMGCANVTFLPPVPPEELVKFYALASVALVTLKKSPINDGARPSKLFPAMATATPIVYSGLGEGATLVKDANAGIVVPPEDPGALAKAIVTLVENPTLAEKMGREGRRYVEENFSWSALVDRWLSELQGRIRK
ncbi:glycosyltransferase family 4 protein [Thermus sp. SYSU G05001]|uniref:Glycosyltransferase family 4 protein n=1 Tax=Thermus brevis TaxID=2862456 RepID=A0ABS6ZYJ9_9DEIN|nr:glycosyltransferase family 4 protein [Thermus brevis]MBW6394562.1 glycosyltransferase family 4 protein [Thermus brevis]